MVPMGFGVWYHPMALHYSPGSPARTPRQDGHFFSSTNKADLPKGDEILFLRLGLFWQMSEEERWDRYINLSD